MKKKSKILKELIEKKEKLQDGFPKMYVGFVREDDDDQEE